MKIIRILQTPLLLDPSWHMTYTWGFYDVSESAFIEEGGVFGFGRFRARYHHANANNDYRWRDYSLNRYLSS